MDAKTLCLGVLMLGDATGYEIRKQFEEGPFAYFHETSFGSIYPALNKLAAEELVTCKDVAQEGKPDKKVYAITDAGRSVFRTALHKVPTKDKIRSESLYMLFFADLLEPRHLRAVFEDYLDFYRANVERLVSEENEHCPSTQDMPKHCLFTRNLGLRVYETIVDYMEENSHMLFDEETDEPQQAPKLRA